MVNNMDRHTYHIRKEIESKSRICKILDHVWYKEDVWTDDEVAIELWVCDRCGKQEKREPLKGASDR